MESTRATTNEDVLTWWSLNSNLYQTLAKLARDVLSTMSTSVPVERFFSIAGLILTKNRRCKNDILKCLLCINFWVHSDLKNKICEM